MPQIKLDFLYLVQTYVLKNPNIGACQAVVLMEKARRVDVNCLNNAVLADMAIMFCDELALKGEAPPWCVFES
jgi:hypothetical protein